MTQITRHPLKRQSQESRGVIAPCGTWCWSAPNPLLLLGQKSPGKLLVYGLPKLHSEGLEHFRSRLSLAHSTRNVTSSQVQVFKSSQEIQERLVRAYELMLGFYGIRLEDRGTGTVGRAQNYQKRFQNLNWRSHNNLRITRILKSLGELGLEHFQAPLVRFFLEETLVRRELPGVRQSALDYFMFTVRCRNQRRQLVHFAWEHFRPRCKFVWGPPDKLRRFKPSSLPRPLEGTRKAEEEGSPGDPDHKTSTQGRTCGPEHSKGRGRVDEGPQPRSVEPQDAGPLERSQGDEAGGHGEDGPEPLSPKESKKRKLELSRREQPPTEPGPQSASEVEKIALNLEGCALSQGSLRTGTQEVGGQDPGEAVQPCPQPLGARVADKVRKRRKVDEGAGDSAVVASDGAQTLALAGCPAPSGYPKAGHSENGVEEDTEGRTGPKEGTPGSPSPSPSPSPSDPSGLLSCLRWTLSRMTGSRNWRATRDMCRYRHNYPDLVERDCNGDTPNLSFYRNEIRFLPNGRCPTTAGSRHFHPCLAGVVHWGLVWDVPRGLPGPRLSNSATVPPGGGQRDSRQFLLKDHWFPQRDLPGSHLGLPPASSKGPVHRWQQGKGCCFIEDILQNWRDNYDLLEDNHSYIQCAGVSHVAGVSGIHSVASKHSKPYFGDSSLGVHREPLPPSPAGPAGDEPAESPSETPGPSPAGPAGDEPAESPSETPGPSPAGPAGDEPAKAGEAVEVQDTEAKPSAKSGKP
ncbi:PREDICTED: opioid growth factor receptor [Mandrillus leucophaeus]|uniref:opioid growth factor receptor n=1 Tax=Mandrillus leucophaeus TaxID=9568 RepID=UPI0005F47C3C|nr:PREDICTED: opioid growth factor receptor [Mandrillus leucophaeus]